MVVVAIHDKNRPGLTVTGKLGRPWGLPYWLGWTLLGGPIVEVGYYQRRHRKRGRMISLARHYWPVYQNSVATQAVRDKFRDGVTAWHALTLSQKKFYNDKVYPVAGTGFTRFMSEWLRS